jgi:acetyl esterase/lipase
MGGTDATVISGVCYAVHDGVELRADVYLPEGAGPFPALVMYHGGAWTKGTRASYASWGRYLARHGYVAVSADYRLATSERTAFPESLWDAKAAVQFVRGSAEDYRVDPGRIGVMGGSAGGHLAALVALTAREPSLANPYPDPHAALDASASVAITMAGTFDMLERWEYDQLDRPPGDSSAELYLGGTPMSVRRRYYEASPIFHASRENAHGTRWLIAWGTEDDVSSPERQSLRFSQSLKRAGALVRHAPIVGAPHFFYFETEVDEPGSFSSLLAARMLTFLRAWSGW